MTDKELSIELEKWFNNNINYQNKWCLPTGKILKKQLKSLGNWKNAPRGDPIKGYRERGKNNV